MTTQYKSSQSPRLPANHPAHVDAILERQRLEALQARAERLRLTPKHVSDPHAMRDAAASAVCGTLLMALLVSLWLILS